MIHVIKYIKNAAASALIDEVSTTPKPGLVDMHDNGAHIDMNYHTFMISTQAVVPYIAKMAEVGYYFKDGPDLLFNTIRPIGVRAENAMFDATSGVNTHKGIIFSLGIIAAAAGWYYARNKCFDTDKILNLCAIMTFIPLEADFISIDKNAPKTHGEKLYVKYGCKGIRGEVQKGFPSVRNIALPFFRSLAENDDDFNSIYIQTLLMLMANVDDTNVLTRTNFSALKYVKKEARRVLALGGARTPEGMEAVRCLNTDFIHRNISPGGCADLLAVTIFLWHLEQFRLHANGSLTTNSVPSSAFDSTVMVP